MNGRGTISLITVTDSLSNRFANMSFICACLVVCIHIGFAACTRWYEHIAGRIFDLGYMRIAVPFFFVAAGFFAVGHINTKGWYKYAVISRLKSFGVPYLFWNLTYFAFMSVCIYIATLIGYEGVDSGANVLRFTKFNFNILIWATGRGLSSSTPMPFLWFIRCLYFLVLCLPLCVYCAQSLGRGKDLCVLFMIYCTNLFDPLGISKSTDL